MKVGIIGSGGREHAICQIIKNSNKIDKIFCFPGNAGTKDIAENINIDLENFKNLKNFILDKKIDLIIVGPEKPLVGGLVDYLEKFKIKVFGPNKIASQLEGSKIFTKQLCQKYKIPTAKFGIFENTNDAKKFLTETNFPTVVKADNLASGKGVYICNNESEGLSAVEEIFNGKFGKAKNILIEEFLEGEEMSFFTIHDGKVFKDFDTAQDHKRVLEGDSGKNTGGMGAYSPSRLINEDLKNKILNRIIKPTLEGLSELGTEYKGFLYTGLMIVKNEPYLIEYNVRMGDPECQTILPKLKTDLSDIFFACCEQKLHDVNIEWLNKKSLCIVVCSNGYPEEFQKNVPIENLDEIKLSKSDFLFHAGTSMKNGKITAVGGRVLNFVSLCEDLGMARENIKNNLKKLNWSGGFYRKDIGYKVID
tara:strand:- start:2277 stop:3539 length:1263 start_codon:yes stop_codon:yes gene_type:complete